jgi:hypothetical protein
MIFTIERGKHYSDHFLYKSLNSLVFNRGLEYSVRFDSSCKYQLPKKDQQDVNKLFGYSIGLDHHKNSARFGWHWYWGKINISAYLYRDGERIVLPMAKLELDSWYRFSIEAQEESDCFVISDSESTIAIANVERRVKFRFGFHLWPYFGGNNAAPHNILIQMEKSALNV